MEAPASRNALQLVLAAPLELDARAGDEVFDGARDEHLARACLRRHARPSVDGDAGDLVADELALARVHADPDLKAQRCHRLDDRLGAACRERRPVERCEEPVAGCIDLPPR